MNLSQYAEELVGKKLRCRDVYEGLALDETFIERLDSFIRQFMSEYLVTMKRPPDTSSRVMQYRCCGSKAKTRRSEERRQH